MIFSHRLEPDHHLEEYIAFDGDDEDFVRTCFNQGEDEVPCTNCGHCEDGYFACSEDAYEAEMEKDDNDSY